MAAELAHIQQEDGVSKRKKKLHLWQLAIYDNWFSGQKAKLIAAPRAVGSTGDLCNLHRGKPLPPDKQASAAPRAAAATGIRLLLTVNLAPALRPPLSRTSAAPRALAVAAGEVFHPDSHAAANESTSTQTCRFPAKDTPAMLRLPSSSAARRDAVVDTCQPPPPLTPARTAIRRPDHLRPPPQRLRPHLLAASCTAPDAPSIRSQIPAEEAPLPHSSQPLGTLVACSGGGKAIEDEGLGDERSRRVVASIGLSNT
ncbi:hypothetical protein OsJ_33345 [Oryza sativa Japonica Group]|uniref:Uncharacterized protein n=1 Tax=Oryza sativa subsp. japonica TaxID=39947 RepID=B9G9Y8_ORYSJ|nr:hypothetical protein OsJ_33345 [Oryza sativa Japonica Group]